MTSTGDADAAPRLTSSGTALLALGAIGLPVGWALGYVVVVVAATAALIAVAVGWISTTSVPKVTADRTVQPTRVERGNPAFGLVQLANPHGRRSPACEAVETVRRLDLDRRAAADDLDDVVIAVPPLRAGRSVSVPYRLPTSKRGMLRVGPLSIERGDALGLWRSRRAIGSAVGVLVEPRIIPLDPRPSGRSRHLDGPVSERSPRGSDTFHSLREYAPGDDIRRIHWRSTARVGTLMVREHVDTTEPSTVVVLDLRADRFSGDEFEEAVDVAASVCAASQASGFPVRLVTTAGLSVAVRSGERGRRLADVLTTVQPLVGEPAGDLTFAATEVLRGRERDAITIVSGLVDARDLAAIAATTQRFARPSLVTIRAADGVRWLGGQHLDGPDAPSALRRWHAAPSRAGALGANRPPVGVGA